VVSAHIAVVGGYEAGEDIPAPGGLLNAKGDIRTYATQTFLPDQVAGRAEQHHPDVIAAVVAAYIAIVGLS
jgi:hypothetical protein